MADKITIRLSEFTKTPGGRYREDGEGSAQEWREEFLSHGFKQARSGRKVLVVDLDGVAGIASSFMEEAFGGLARMFGAPEVKSTIQIESDLPEWVEEANQYINEEAVRQTKPPAKNSYTLAEYVHRVEQRILDFQTYWEKNQALDPEYFPDEMGLADWDEQFTFFDNT